MVSRDHPFSRGVQSSIQRVVIVLFSTLFTLLLCSATPGPSFAGPVMGAIAIDTMGHFPNVEGTNLEGEHFTLPSDFKGGMNVVIVAFRREQQGDVDSWMPYLRTLGEGRRDLRIYELPTLGRGYRLMRPFIDGGMRRGIPDAAVRAATITLYIDKGPFRESLRIPDEDRIYLLLVDRRGRVFWRGQGRYDERVGAELARRIREAPSTPSSDAGAG